MFDPSRQFQSCIFCSCPDLSTEHLFGRGFARRVGPLPNWTSFDWRPGAHKMVDGGAPIVSLTSKILCEDCNSSFHGLMARSLDPLIGLVQGTAQGLSADEVLLLMRYFERLGFIVDVCTSNFQLTEEHSQRPEHQRNERWRQSAPTYSQPEREAWFKKQPTNSPTIFIGHHPGVLGLHPFTNVGQYLSVGHGARHSIKTFEMVIGCLAFSIQLGDVCPRVPSASYVRLQGHPTRWPPTRRVSYEDYFAMLAEPNEFAQLRQHLRTRAGRRDYESFVRKQAKVRSVNAATARSR